MSVTAGVSDTVIAVRDKLRGKIGQTKVKRYWPGKAPEWADENDDDENIHMSKSSVPKNDTVSSTLSRKDDPRLRRLSRIDNSDEVRAVHREIRKAEIVSTEEEERIRKEGLDFEETDEDAMEERRRRIREKLLAKQREETSSLLPIEEEDLEESEESEEESEYETDSDEDVAGISMVKPVFVPKSERDTIAERERIEAEEIALEEAVKKRVEERRKETKSIVVEKIREDKEIMRNVELGEDVRDVDTDDELNELETYEAWKVREIARIKRDREERDAVVKEREEIEKVRNMTEEERREWERRNPKPSRQSKQKWRFMQKYYHKGAFFQEEKDEVYTRDFSEPTGEDKLDKSILPKVMQVKHFGRSGRTKWTHLVNEDTTDWNTPWNNNNDPLRAKYNQKMAGMNAPIEKPKGSKKLKDWESK